MLINNSKSKKTTLNIKTKKTNNLRNWGQKKGQKVQVANQ